MNVVHHCWWQFTKAPSFQREKWQRLKHPNSDATCLGLIWVWLCSDGGEHFLSHIKQVHFTKQPSAEFQNASEIRKNQTSWYETLIRKLNLYADNTRVQYIFLYKVFCSSQGLQHYTTCTLCHHPVFLPKPTIAVLNPLSIPLQPLPLIQHILLLKIFDIMTIMVCSIYKPLMNNCHWLSCPKSEIPMVSQFWCLFRPKLMSLMTRDVHLP